MATKLDVGNRVRKFYNMEVGTVTAVDGDFVTVEFASGRLHVPQRFVVPMDKKAKRMRNRGPHE